MNSVVCIAQVPDTETRIKIAPDGRHIDETGVKFIVSPYDEYALEEAIRAKEKQAGDVTDNAPLRGGKGMLYEGGIRVPLIARRPGAVPRHHPGV